ncbi:MAG: hypothetical protein ACLPKW_20125 [Acetobacteraceae bacterium]|jgi:hypothetical protein
MSRTRNATFAVAILSLIQSGGAIAQKPDTIVGTWLLRSIQIDRDGKKVDLYGPHAVGMAIFDNGGHYISVVINPDVPKFASNARQSGTAEETRPLCWAVTRFSAPTRLIQAHEPRTSISLARRFPILRTLTGIRPCRLTATR